MLPTPAAQEAVFCKDIIANSGVLLELPVFFDIEDADNYKKRHGFIFSRKNVTNICKAFLDNIKPLNAGVYASFSWLEDFIDWQSLDCPIWNAQWEVMTSCKVTSGSTLIRRKLVTKFLTRT